MPPHRPSSPRFLPVLLALPALIPLLWSWASAHARGLVFTGFIQYDMPYYLANARQHFSNGFQWTYSNPYAPYGSPAIYFQPHIFVLALMQRAGLDPALALNLFGIAAMLFASIVAARLYETVVGWETLAQKIGLVCFFWGGGVLALAGLAFGWLAGLPAAKAVVTLDAGDGWWMFNFGRNLVYPTEAYYHGVFLLTLLMLIRARRAWAVGLTALMSASHPFTGLSLGLIVAAYSALEACLNRSAAWWKAAVATGAVLATHVGYYLIFLNRFADHRALRQQWELDWPYLAWTFVPAMYIVGFLAFLRMSRWSALKSVLADARMRLFLVCFAVVFLLSHHDLLLKPVQPLHFAHGYDWIALFFLASPVLIRLLDRLLAIRLPIVRAAAVAAFVLVMISDNLLWLASFRDRAVQRYAITLTRDQADVLQWLSSGAPAGGEAMSFEAASAEVVSAEVVSEDEQIGYLVPTYTSMRSHYGHTHNTPLAPAREREVAEIFRGATTLDASGPVYYIPLLKTGWAPPPGARRVHGNGSYVVWLKER